MAEDQGGGKLQRTTIDRSCSLVKWSLILRQFCCIIQAGFQLRASGDALALGSWVAGAMHSHQGALLPKLFLLNDDSSFKNTPRSRDYRMTSVLVLTQFNLLHNDMGLYGDQAQASKQKHCERNPLFPLKQVKKIADSHSRPLISSSHSGSRFWDQSEQSNSINCILSNVLKNSALDHQAVLLLYCEG